MRNRGRGSRIIPNKLCVFIRGGTVRWSHGDGLGALAITSENLSDWADRYGKAVIARQPELLRDIGMEMLTTLGQGWDLLTWVNGPDPELEIQAASQAARGSLDDVLTRAPWELLATDKGYLAGDDKRPFVVARRLGEAGQAWPPESRDFSLLFMAASPDGASVLDHEAEEAAILQATTGTTPNAAQTYLVVEELGGRAPMRDRVAHEGPFEAVHLSCHGGIDEDLGPFLALEAEDGALDPTPPGELLDAFVPKKPPLVFVSACLTAAVAPDIPHAPPRSGGRQNTPDGNGDRDTRGISAVTESYVTALAGAGVANVVGWDGSVADIDAIDFAEVFYDALARGETVPQAAALARRAVLEIGMRDPPRGQDWHLARVYLGAGGGGPLIERDMPERQRPPVRPAFLDPDQDRVPVATPEEFVGRRKEIQRVIRAFGSNNPRPALLYGMGNLGKSSLAARVAQRLTHLHTIVLHERYAALDVLTEVLKAVPPQQRQGMRDIWAPQVLASDAALGLALEDMLKGVLREHPILLIADDLEQQVLEAPVAGKPAVEPRSDEFRAVLAAILTAFRASPGRSRLLMTSRYSFRVPDDGRDLMAGVEVINLNPMNERDRQKQWSALARRAGGAGLSIAAGSDADAALKRAERFVAARASALDAAAGNPGLQDILTKPLLNGDAEIDAVEKAITEVQNFRATGRVPTEASAAQEFFARVTMETYRNALTAAEARALSATALFSENIPVPRPALRAAIEAVGVDAAEPALDRLLALGLLDDLGAMFNHPHAATNPLARPLAAALTEAKTKDLATRVAPELAGIWRNEDGGIPRSALVAEVARLALKGDVDPATLDAAANAGARWLFHNMHDATTALDAILEPALARLDHIEAVPSAELLMIAFDCGERAGNVDLKLRCLDYAGRTGNQSPDHKASLLLRKADFLHQSGDLDEALECLKEARVLFSKAGIERDAAIASGKIADILMARGRLDEAEAIRREEELPVFERLGDIREKAVTLGKIADILMARGRLDEAEAIRREEELPVFERLGDIREKAVTQVKLAGDILAQGRPGEAAPLYNEARAVFEAMGMSHYVAIVDERIAALTGAGESA